MIVYDSDSVIHQMNAESSCYDSKFQKIYNSPHVRAIFIFTGWLLFNLYMNSFTNDLRIHLLYGFISSCGFLLIIIFILCEDACSIFQYGFFWRIALKNNTSQENSLIIIQDSKMIKILELTFFSLMINVGELNAFLLKQTYVPFFLHWLNVIRLFLVSILSLRGIESNINFIIYREHYNFFSKKNTKNFGMFHFFVMFDISSTISRINFILEFLLILNHNNEITNRIDRNRIFLWIFSQFASIYFLVHFSDSYIAGQKEQMKQTVDVKQKLT
ncbi:hypothetical protein HZS_6284 [Henneguya salminicola]|nr:hypothetical protein HZS_6284 [Henneguya salminicola]